MDKSLYIITYSQQHLEKAVAKFEELGYSLHRNEDVKYAGSFKTVVVFADNVFASKRFGKGKNSDGKIYITSLDPELHLKYDEEMFI